MNENSEHMNSTKQPDKSVRFLANDDLDERLEFTLVRSEEEVNVDEGPATDQSLTQHSTSLRTSYRMVI